MTHINLYTFKPNSARIQQDLIQISISANLHLPNCTSPSSFFLLCMRLCIFMWPHVLHIIITMQYVCSSYKYDPFERIRLCAGGRLQSTSCCVGSASTLGFSAHAADIRQASYQPWCAMANNPHHIKVERHNAGNGRMMFVCWGIFSLSLCHLLSS